MKRGTATASASPPIDPWGDDNPANTSPREFNVIGFGEQYVLRLLDVPIEFTLDRLRRDHGELFGQLTVRTQLAGARTFNGVLNSASFNCSAASTRLQRAKQLRDMSKATQIDWERLLEEFCLRVAEAEDRGQPALVLRDIPRPEAADSIDVCGIRIFEKHPMILFSDGGVGKSLLALFVAGELAQRGLTVLYADWELDADDHRLRLERFFGADMPRSLLYAKCVRPMTAESDRLSRLVRQHKADYLICDSVSFACDGPPEAAEVAARYFQCCRQIGVGSMHLAHTNKSDDSDKKPFGSAFWHNGARATWNAKPSQSSLGSRQLTIGLYNRKSNLGPLLPAVGLTVTFDMDRTRVEQVNVADVEDLAQGMALWQRIKPLVARGAKTNIEIATALGEPVDSIRKAMERKPNVFTKVNSQDGVVRFALVDRQRSGRDDD